MCVQSCFYAKHVIYEIFYVFVLKNFRQTCFFEKLHNAPIGAKQVVDKMGLTHIIEIFFVLLSASGNKDVKYAEHALVIIPQLLYRCIQIYFADEVVECI